ncbi:MAG: ester cyclase [Aestuariivirga sp.]
MTSATPTKANLTHLYRSYIACLNAQDWNSLGNFVADKVIHNGKAFGLAGYHAMLVNDFETIPDLAFNIQILAVDPPYVTSRLWFECAPKAMFVSLPINGRKISFAENVIYEFSEGKIVEVWSVLDKAAIEAQL